ncbi:hypothetical protein PIB30_067600 [Stylosanthes scabra]|uniref:Uncharacterized protein n=1 Tax=Stylosanthes scabra TaxID=79078 RepID=A0ABU6VM83_9FABA|nr:hypothetical protein [Stylosanthes scabra]
MAGDKPSSPAKGKAKAYGPPTRASSRLVALRSQSAANPQPETPVTPAVIAPTPSLPPKKRHIQKAAGEGTSKAAAQSFRRQSHNSKPEPAIKDTIRKIVDMDEDEEEDLEEDLEEAPQDAEVEEHEEEEEDPEEDLEEESAAKLVLHGEDDFANYWALVESDSEDAARDDPRFWDYDGDLPDWGNVDPANSSSRSCTRPPLANL